MKKITCIFVFVIFMMLAGCGTAGGSFNNVQIEGIEIYTAEANPANIWKINWPDSYMSGDQKIPLGVTGDILSDKDRKYLLEYAEEHKNTHESDGEFLCRVELKTLEDKTHSSITMYIYDEYPEGFETFAGTINGICGGKEIFFMNGTVREVTPEYFTAVTGKTDAEINGGTVSELIEHLNIRGLWDLVPYTTNLYLDNIAQNYELCRFLQYEVKSAPCTEEEWRDYALKLAGRLGYTGEVNKESSEYDDEEWYVIKDYKGSDIRVYRSEDVADDIYNRGGSLDRYYLSYKIFENTTPPGDELSGYAQYDFTYSRNNKFAIAVTGISGNGPEREAFLEAALAAEETGE